MEMNNNDPTFGSLTVIIRKKLSKAGNFNYPPIYYFPSFIKDKLRYSVIIRLDSRPNQGPIIK